MKIKTITKVNITQARAFEDEQGLKGVRKENIFSHEDCFWQLETGKYAFNGSFSIPVSWYQIQEYETGDPENPTGLKQKLMFSETFTLTNEQVQQLWTALNGQILSSDSLIGKLDEFVLNGIIYWVGTVRGIFGLTNNDWEII